MRLLGVALALAAVVLAAGRAFQRSGLLEKWLGWSALHGFFQRTLEILSTAPLLVALLTAGATLIVIGTLGRR
ncbi:MAG: hypothetical protein DYG94_12840 [Leptolyngbya sp. PLA3]|nr:MAG: hypothetical protein EDM82_12310 [Cyanobacteria bacterium CYA]MCE7969611.1 hypothetical protein [Leptolyngbya sp. PL-A3]